jgi:hypothetical protein
MIEWATRFGAVGVAAVLDAVVLWCASTAARPALIALVALATLLLVAVAILRLSQPIAPAIFLLGGGFVAIDGLGLIARAVVVPYAFGLFLIAELAYESTRPGWRPSAERDRARLIYLAAVAGISLFVSIVVLIVTAELALGAVAELVGLGASVGALGLIGAIVRGPRRRPIPVPVRVARDKREDRRR